ncbi:hypothetical protein [Erwinia phage phiEaP8]|uniref:Uncharacterized protein n=1 Tax=Erwinia phage phiEaP8 TaxID=2178928 RepID=A0A3G1QTR8_9CAUD|nr:hypothetical protein HYP64_gp34 [Erwinia phage phiEaP8]AWN06258.1 hypothetical protein [Erwinia phage phiEaP8]
MKWLFLFLFAVNVQAATVGWKEITPGTILELSDIVPNEDSMNLVPTCRQGYLLRQKTIGHVEPTYGCWTVKDDVIVVQYTDLTIHYYKIEGFYKGERTVNHKQAPSKSGAK